MQDTLSDKDQLHPFECANLGQSPFRYVGMRENVYSACPGHSQPGGTCAYCGQGIRYECVIKSHDGETFVVGMDCVAKLGRADNRLVDAVKRERLKLEQAKRQAERDARWAAREAENKAELDRQRQVNGGLTDYELGKQKAAEEERLKADQYRQANQWLINVLKTKTGGFVDSMRHELESRSINALSPRQISILRDIYGKSHGRSGSKKYDRAADEFDSKMETKS